MLWELPSNHVTMFHMLPSEVENLVGQVCKAGEIWRDFDGGMLVGRGGGWGGQGWITHLQMLLSKHVCSGLFPPCHAAGGLKPSKQHSLPAPRFMCREKQGPGEKASPTGSAQPINSPTSSRTFKFKEFGKRKSAVSISFDVILKAVVNSEHCLKSGQMYLVRRETVSLCVWGHWSPASREEVEAGGSASQWQPLSALSTWSGPLSAGLACKMAPQHIFSPIQMVIGGDWPGEVPPETSNNRGVIIWDTLSRRPAVT